MRLFLYFIAAVFVVFPFSARAACVEADVTKQVSALLIDINSSPQAVSISRQIELGVEKGFVKPARKKAMLEAALEYYVRKTAKCPVPDTLNARVSDALSIGASDGERCHAGQFSKAVDRQYATIKSSGGYEVFEGMIKQQVSSLVVADAGAVFIERWDDNPKFREKVIRAGLEMGVMQVSRCSNPEAPILKIIEEF